jgi:hypothetical protein
VTAIVIVVGVANPIMAAVEQVGHQVEDDDGLAARATRRADFRPVRLRGTEK